ncbi:uncharacterized protein METZ01_LOCUS507175 [marine metagenome]|uniref:Uncharacterized protein n=1 Tax=marine metagenome TaxID=408172 RepID=A0A383EC78_9ZZZZ
MGLALSNVLFPPVIVLGRFQLASLRELVDASVLISHLTLEVILGAIVHHHDVGGDGPVFP